MKSTLSIALGSDDAGFKLKEMIKEELKKMGYEVGDFGTDSSQSEDYPLYAEKVSKAVADGQYARGILICGTGIGMSIVANKLKGIRAAVCWDIFTAKASRAHNDANILCLGGRILLKEEAKAIVKVWLTEEFEAGRHQRRKDQLKDIENKLDLME